MAENKIEPDLSRSLPNFQSQPAPTIGPPFADTQPQAPIESRKINWPGLLKIIVGCLVGLFVSALFNIFQSPLLFALSSPVRFYYQAATPTGSYPDSYYNFGLPWSLFAIFFKYAISHGLPFFTTWIVLRLFLNKKLALIIALVSVFASSTLYRAYDSYKSNLRSKELAEEQIEKKAAIGPISEKQEILEKSCFTAYTFSYSKQGVRAPIVSGYDRFKECDSQYLFINYEDVRIRETKNSFGLPKDGETRTIGGHEVKILERDTDYSPPETVYTLIIGETRIELTWNRSVPSPVRHSLIIDGKEIIISDQTPKSFNESDIEGIISTLEPI